MALWKLHSQPLPVRLRVGVCSEEIENLMNILREVTLSWKSTTTIPETEKYVFQCEERTVVL